MQLTQVATKKVEFGFIEPEQGALGQRANGCGSLTAIDQVLLQACPLHPVLRVRPDHAVGPDRLRVDRQDDKCSICSVTLLKEKIAFREFKRLIARTISPSSSALSFAKWNV